MLSGNKSDLEDYRKVSFQEGEQFAIEHNFLFFETSAKRDVNVNLVFENGLKEYAKVNDDAVHFIHGLHNLNSNHDANDYVY